MSSSIGPVQTGRPKFGECRYCWDENWSRDHGLVMDSRSHMVGTVCGHRLHKPKRAWKQFRKNRIIIKQMSNPKFQNYWMRRALLPDYCGEFGEKSLLALAGLRYMDDEDAEAAVQRAKQKIGAEPIENL